MVPLDVRGFQAQVTQVIRSVVSLNLLVYSI